MIDQFAIILKIGTLFSKILQVYIHGGAYIFGWGTLANGYFLLEHDVILVSMNYRLNAFGFLSLNTTEVSGNQGLRDQQLALKWVQKNIHHFGC